MADCPLDIIVTDRRLLLVTETSDVLSEGTCDKLLLSEDVERN